VLPNQQVAGDLDPQLFHIDSSIGRELIGESFFLIEQDLRRIRDVNLGGHPVFLKLIGDQHLAAVDIVPDNISANDSSDDVARVDADPHIELHEIHFLPGPLDDIDHRRGHVDHIEGLDLRVPVVRVCEAHDHVAVPDRVQFVDLVFQTFFVEVREELAQEFYYVLGVLEVLVGVGCESFDVREEDCHVLELVCQLELVVYFLGFQF
jgi:hypothetical protein